MQLEDTWFTFAANLAREQAKRLVRERIAAEAVRQLLRRLAIENGGKPALEVVRSQEVQS